MSLFDYKKGPGLPYPIREAAQSLAEALNLDRDFFKANPVHRLRFQLLDETEIQILVSVFPKPRIPDLGFHLPAAPSTLATERPRAAPSPGRIDVCDHGAIRDLCPDCSPLR